MDGSHYTGTCACLLGTVANVRGVSYYDLGIEPNSDRPAERFAMGVSRGDTPATSQVSALLEQWIVEWQADRAAAVSPVSEPAPGV